jgi:hypothetical protein
MSTQRTVGVKLIPGLRPPILQPRAPLDHDVEEALELDADLLDVRGLEAGSEPISIRQATVKGMRWRIGEPPR